MACLVQRHGTSRTDSEIERVGTERGSAQCGRQMQMQVEQGLVVVLI